MNTEQIDQSEWLPRNSNVINPYRAAKPDITGELKGEGAGMHISYAEVRDVSIARGLIERGFIEEFHVGYGFTLLEFQKAFYGRLSWKGGLAEMSGYTSQPITPGIAKEIYAAVAAAITSSRVRIIEHALNSEYERDIAAKTIAGIDAYRQCFELLAFHMEEERKRIEEEERSCISQR